MAILDGYFPNSPVDLGHVDDALALDTLQRLRDEGVHQNCPLATTVSYFWALDSTLATIKC